MSAPDETPDGAQETTDGTETAPETPAASTGLFDVVDALARHVSWHGDEAGRQLVTTWLDEHPDNPANGPDDDDDQDDAPAPAASRTAPGNRPGRTSRRSGRG